MSKIFYVVFLFAVVLFIGVSGTLFAADENLADKDDKKVESVTEKSESETPKKDEASEVVNPTKTEEVKKEEFKPRGSKGLNFFGQANQRLYVKLYERGLESGIWTPLDAYFAIKAQLGATFDLGPTFFELCLSTDSGFDTGGYSAKASSKYPTTSILNDFNDYVHRAYGVVRASDAFQMVFGRYGWVIDSKKHLEIVRNGNTFHSDYAMDGLGFFFSLMNNEESKMAMTASATFSYLDKSSGLSPEADNKFSWLIGLQPKLYMDNMLVGLGLWAITHPSNIDSSFDTDHGFMVLEAFFSMSFASKMKAYFHITYNIASEDYPFGALIGFKYGSAKKPGEFEAAFEFFFVEKYSFYKNFVDHGFDEKGVRLTVTLQVSSNVQ